MARLIAPGRPWRVEGSPVTDGRISVHRSDADDGTAFYGFAVDATSARLLKAAELALGLEVASPRTALRREDAPLRTLAGGEDDRSGIPGTGPLTSARSLLPRASA